MNLKFGENLRKYRLNAGLTQEQLAEIFGVSLQSVSRWETQAKASYPDIELIVAISRHFGVSVDELLGTDDRRSFDIDWAEFEAIKEVRERYNFLIEQKKHHPDDPDIDHQLCWTARGSKDDKDIVEAGIAAAKRLLKSQESVWYRSPAATALLALCPEDELDDYIDEYFYGRAPSLFGLLRVRYNADRDFECLETLRKDCLTHMLSHYLNSLLVVLDGNGEESDETYIERNRVQLKLYDLICGIKPPEDSVIGDGEVDMWSDYRVRAALELAKLYYRIAEKDKADKILTELIGFIEKMWNIPDGTLLTYRSPIAEGISAEVTRREYKGRIFVEAIHDSYFYREQGFWFTPQWYLDILEEPVALYPDNDILRSVYERIKSLK